MGESKHDDDKREPAVADPPRNAVRPVRSQLVPELLWAVEAREEDPDLEFPAEAEAVLRDALQARATDIHIDPQITGTLVRLRVDGIVFDAAFLSREQGRRLSSQLKSMARLSPVTTFVPLEGRLTYALDETTLDLRVVVAPCLRGDKLTLRLFEPKLVPESLPQLGLEHRALEHIEEWLGNISGMLLVAGPTGSGKTTTLYALLQRLKGRERNVVTIEDPVEYEVPGINHIQIDSVHGLDFPAGIKAMLRLDPDYVMVGEIRDAPSARAAVGAAASGRALMSTLHSRDAVGVIDVLRNLGVTTHEVSANLVLVVAQRLVRTLCPHCRDEGAPTEEERRWLQAIGRTVPERVWHPRGCDACDDLGYRGRTGVFEVWRIDAEEYQLLLNNADRKTLYRHLHDRGHQFLVDDGLRKAAAGVTSIDELRGMMGLSAIEQYHIDQLEIGPGPSDASAGLPVAGDARADTGQGGG